MPPEHLPFFTFLRATGCSREEGLTLTRSQINSGKRREVIFFWSKDQRERAVPLSEAAIEAIEAMPPSPFTKYVFYNPVTLHRWHDCRKPWENARRKAKSRLWIHELRLFYAIRLAENEVPMNFIQSMLGHASVTTTEKYYARFSPRAAHKAVLGVIEGGRSPKAATGGGNLS